MSIEKAMNELKTQIRYYKDFWGADASDYVIDTFNTAISTMHKYQKIEQLIADYENEEWKQIAVYRIREIIDGNDD